MAAAIEAGAGDASALPACAERCGQQLMRIVELVRGELSALNRLAAKGWYDYAVCSRR